MVDLSLVKKILRTLALAAAFLGLLSYGLPLPAGTDYVSRTALTWGERVVRPVCKQLFIDYSGMTPTWTVPRPLWPVAGTDGLPLWDRLDLCGQVRAAGIDLPGLRPVLPRSEAAGGEVLLAGERLMNRRMATRGFSAALSETGLIWPRGQPREEAG